MTNKSLANVDATANTKLSGIEALADVTSTHTAANITGQGALATQGSVDLATGEVTNKSLANVDATANTKLSGIEALADVTASHADDVIYRGNTPPAHQAGRVWYCLENVSYDNYTLYRSTGAAWEIVSDTTAQHQADVQLANVTGDADDISDGATNKFAAESGADVTASHAQDVIYRGNTPPAHQAGRVWYCLENVSYDNYTLYRSTGAAWEIVSDTTAQHQADVQLANVSGNLDDITNGSTYAKMLATWRHTSDTTMINGGLIFAKSITAVSGALDDLVVGTAQINNLNVTTVKIGNNAVTIPASAFTAGSVTLTDASETQIQTSGSYTSAGGAVFIHAGAVIDCGGAYDINIYRDATKIYSSGTISPGALTPWSMSLNDTPGSGSYTYTVKVDRGGNSGIPRSATYRSLLLLEVKK